MAEAGVDMEAAGGWTDSSEPLAETGAGWRPLQSTQLVRKDAEQTLQRPQDAGPAL